MALCCRNGGSIYPGRVALCCRTDGSTEPGIFIYYAYHSMDPLNAVQRLMEAKGIDPDTDCTIEAGVRLLRKIRKK